MYTVGIAYVNGGHLLVDPSEWASVKSQGIDYVDLIDESGLSLQASRIQGQSVYWLYKEGAAWVAGGGIVGRTEIIEVVVPGHTFRRPEYMPDLNHDQVKLGWWEAGTR